MADPTLEALQAENARLRYELSQRDLQRAFTPSPPHLTSASDRTVIEETPRQTTITHSRVPPTAEPFLRKATPLPLKGKMTADEIVGAIDGIKAVIVSGVESAAYGDKRSEFRTLAELRQILDGLENELDEALGRGGRIRQIRMTTKADKGL